MPSHIIYGGKTLNILSTASCGNNMVYDPAINSVQPSCKQPNPPQVSSGGAAEGCKCKEGYLLDEGGNRCVREEDCGCAVEDNYYPVSEFYISKIKRPMSSTPAGG